MNWCNVQWKWRTLRSSFEICFVNWSAINLWMIFMWITFRRIFYPLPQILLNNRVHRPSIRGDKIKIFSWILIIISKKNIASNPWVSDNVKVNLIKSNKVILLTSHVVTFLCHHYAAREGFPRKKKTYILFY